MNPLRVRSTVPLHSNGAPERPHHVNGTTTVRDAANAHARRPFGVRASAPLAAALASLLMATTVLAEDEARPSPAPTRRPAAAAAPASTPSSGAVASGTGSRGSPATAGDGSAATAPSAVTAAPAGDAKSPTLEETRLTLSKWIETQQIISKERNEWQQGREILQGRIDLVGKEVGTLKDRIVQAETAVKESNRKRDELMAQNAQLKETGAQLVSAVTALEEKVRRLAKIAPEGLAKKLEPLLQRVPTDPATTRVSVAERFQNVLGILNELNKANSEISIAFEIRKLADGSSSEVQVIYVGLGQAYYLSPRGEAGIGRPGDNGWTWEPPRSRRVRSSPRSR